MSHPLLSICIPTYNRVNFLKDLLPGLMREIISADQGNPEDVELLISDNASTDLTQDYIQSLNSKWVQYHRNEENIGAGRNYFKCIQRATGDYVWLFGDDELIIQGGIRKLLQVLRYEKPDLVILDGEDHVPSFYPDYSSCVRDMRIKKRNRFSLTHTLITANVFKIQLFDMPYACRRLGTDYPHMFGFMKKLTQKGTVAVLGLIMRERQQRAQFNKWPFALCVKQGFYLFCLARWTGLRFLYWQAIILCLNLPVEILSCFLHRFFPGKFGRT